MLLHVAGPELDSGAQKKDKKEKESFFFNIFLVKFRKPSQISIARQPAAIHQGEEVEADWLSPASTTHRHWDTQGTALDTRKQGNWEKERKQRHFWPFFSPKCRSIIGIETRDASSHDQKKQHQI